MRRNVRDDLAAVESSAESAAQYIEWAQGELLRVEPSSVEERCALLNVHRHLIEAKEDLTGTRSLPEELVAAMLKLEKGA